MNKLYGVYQIVIHDTMMKSRFLGTFIPSLSISYLQKMKFTKYDDGLFDMSPNENIDLKNGNIVSFRY